MVTIGATTISSQALNAQPTRRLAMLTILSSALFARLSRSHTLEDVENAIATASAAIVSLSDKDEPRAPALLYAYAELLLCRFELIGESNDAQEALTLLRKALALRPDHTHRYLLVLSLAKASHAVFCLTGNLQILADSIEHGRLALSLVDTKRHNRTVLHAILAKALLSSFRLTGLPSELDKCIEHAHIANDTCLVGSFGRPDALDILARALLARHEQRDTPSDLPSAIGYAEEAVALCPDEHADRSRALGTLAAVLFARFEYAGMAEDLEKCASLSCDALALCMPSSPIRSNHLDTLIPALTALFVESCQESILDAAIHNANEALLLRPPGHPDRPRSLIDDGTAKCTRFLFSTDKDDIDNSVLSFREAVRLLLPDSPIRVGAMSRLSDALQYRFLTYGDPEDIQESVACAKDALNTCDKLCLSRAVALNSLASALHRRFAYVGDPEDSRLSMEHFRQALAWGKRGAPTYLNTLVRFMTFLFDPLSRNGNRDLLLQSVGLGQVVLESMATKNLHRPTLLAALSRSACFQYERSVDIADLNAGLALVQEALNSCSETAFARPDSLLCLANVLLTRFRRTQELVDFSQCEELIQDALSLSSPRHYLRHKLLEQLGEAYIRLHTKTGDVEDLDKAVVHLHKALEICPPQTPSRPSLIYRLVTALDNRSSRTKRVEDIEVAIQHLQQALPSYAQGEPTHALMLRFLAKLSYKRFLMTKTAMDLKALIEYADKALAPPCIAVCDNSDLVQLLAFALQERYRRHGGRDDLDKSIDYGYQALALCPPGDTECVDILGDLATALRRRFEAGGNLEDLHVAITHLRRRLQMAPSAFTSPFRLAEALMARFLQTAQLDDLRDAIQHGHDALSLCPPDHPERWLMLYQLSSYLSTRYKLTEYLEDSTTCISLLREMLSLELPADQPAEAPGRISLLCYLSACFRTRWRHTQNPEDLAESMNIAQEALHLCAPNHPHRKDVLSNLGEHYGCLYESTEQPVHLHKSIDYFRVALLTPPQSFSRNLSLTAELGHALVLRYRALRGMEDLEECIEHERRILAIAPAERTFTRWHRALCQFNLASALAERHHSTGSDDDVLEAIFHARSCVIDSGLVFKPAEHLQHALFWARLAHGQRHPSTMDAYRKCLEIMEQKLLTAPTLEIQHETVKEQQSLPLDAAAYAISEGNLHLAVEILEQGRALLWSQIRRLRTPLDDLSLDEKTIPLRDTFMEKSRALQAISMYTNSFRLSTQASDEDRDPYGSLLETKRRLSAELDAITEQIREHVPDFLRPPAFENIKIAAAEGPVILVNHSVFRSDALILSPDENVSCVELSTGFYERAKELLEDLLEARHALHTAPKRYDQVLRRTLQELGDILVGPVVEKLEELGVDHGSRIWWCPTSVVSALPIHAAGPFRTIASETMKRKTYLLDLYLPSYTPTLTALIRARATRNDDAARHGGLLCIAPEDKSLTAVDEEVNILRTHFVERDLTLATGTACNREAVVTGLALRSWVHFACHGTLKPGRPLNSAFILSGTRDPNGLLTILDVVKLIGGSHDFELAVLSACHTAEQTRGSVLDEVLHLAAAMQFAGFRSVVGTMWQVQDDDGPVFAQHFYDAILEEQDIRGALSTTSRDTFKGAARAVCSATKEMRRARVALERWVNFIHIGA